MEYKNQTENRAFQEMLQAAVKRLQNRSGEERSAYYTILRKFHSCVDFSFKFHYSCNYIIYNHQTLKNV